ncbi:Uncharacterised protein [Agrobacterium tumefaciens]|nr:Uncharacterised protein [Agrobacterium tumefaciens]
MLAACVPTTSGLKVFIFPRLYKNNPLLYKKNGTLPVIQLILHSNVKNRFVFLLGLGTCRDREVWCQRCGIRSLPFAGLL